MDNNKDIANSLNKLTEYSNKGTNLLLDSAENINKWYEKQLNKITENDIDNSRIETGVDNSIVTDNINEKGISTKVYQYDKIQTNKNNDKSNIINSKKIQTASEKDNNTRITKENMNGTIIDKNDSKLKISKKISTGIKGAKLVNNSAQKMIKTGKNINTGLNENSIASFKDTSSRIMTKPIKKVGDKFSNKVTKESVKYTKKIKKKNSSKFSKK